MNALVLLLLLQTGIGTDQGDTQTVTLQLSGIGTTAKQLDVTLHARNVADPRKSVDFVVQPLEASIRLPAGQWFVSASRLGYWSESVLVSVATQPVHSTLKLYRATPVRAAVTVPSSATVQSVEVHFNPSDSTSALPASSITCPVTKGSMNCDVPSGVYDLSFRIRGHAVIHRWNVDLRGAERTGINTLAFRVGSTLRGQVDVDHSEPLPSFDAIEVTLRNVVADGRNDELRSRESITRAVVRPNQRGLFSFDVAPGTYLVSAAANGLRSEEREVTVTDAPEVVLREPLTLTRPFTLTVNVRVPPEGANRAWKLAMMRVGTTVDELVEEVVDVPPDGVCRFVKQFPGVYEVMLRLADSVWATQRLTLEHDTTIEMAARATVVRGSIRMADKPLAARAMFQASDGDARVHVTVQSRSDGTFLAFLPDLPGDRWGTVTIQSMQPFVKRVLDHVVLDRDDDGRATLEIRLPAARIDGIVVDERDQRVTEAVITMTGPDDETQQAETSDGTFAFDGLQPGRYVLTAFTRDRETGDPMRVDLGDDGAQRHVVLKVTPVSELHGSVVSAWGPVIGASVFITPANYAHPVIVSRPVDAAGEFRFPLPPNTQELQIAVTAPGFAFRMMRIPAPETRFELAVDQNGGALTIDGAVGVNAQPLRPYVIHNGAVLTAYAMVYLARGRFLGNLKERMHFEIPSAEEGVYTLCLLSREEEPVVLRGAVPPSGQCVSGLLPRHGTLTLQAPNVDEPATAAR